MLDVGLGGLGRLGGLAPGKGAGGGASIPLLGYGSRIAFVGHSKVAQQSSPTMRSFVRYAMTKLSSALRPAVAADQGIGGNTIAQIQARIANTTAQKPDVIVLMVVHNSLGDGATSVNAALDTLKSTIEAACPTAICLWLTELPSTSYPVGNATLDAINAHIMGFAGTNGGRTRALDVSTSFNSATMTYDGVHQNRLGAKTVGNLLAAELANIVETISVETILDGITAANDWGADACPTATHTLTGTAGTKAGTGSAQITGSIADSLTVTNNSTALTVTCSKDVQSGYERQVITISGSLGAETAFTVATTNTTGKRAAINAVIGDAIESMWGFSLTAADGTSAPGGVLEFGSSLPTTIAGLSLGNYNATDSNRGGAVDEPFIDKIARTQGKVQPVAMNNLSPLYGLRLNGTVDVKLILWKPIVRKTELTAYAAPAYVGYDGILGATERVAFYNLATITNGAATPLAPGVFSGGALSYGAKRVYLAGSGGDAGLGSGTLQATIAAGTWSWTAAVTSGQPYFLEADVTNSLGSDSARMAASINGA